MSQFYSENEMCRNVTVCQKSVYSCRKAGLLLTIRLSLKHENVYAIVPLNMKYFIESLQGYLISPKAKRVKYINYQLLAVVLLSD